MKNMMILKDLRTLEDIVFEDRNKAYGAYDLNRKGRKYLFIAFLIALTGVSTAIAVPYLNAVKNPGFKWIPGKEVKAIIDKIDVDPVIPPPPPPPRLPENTLKQAQYIPPVIVDKETEGPGISIMGDLIDNTFNVPVPLELPQVEKPAPEINEPETEFYLFPEEQASFMNGDLTEFRNWIQRNVIYPQKAIEIEIFGKVIIGFCVNSKGEVVDVSIVRGVDPLLDQESMRVISSSPLWRAARQGGKPVKQRFIVPVVFQLKK